MMKQVPSRLVDWSLYAILDKEVAEDLSLALLAEQVIAGGAGVIQLRDKVSTSASFYHEAMNVKAVTDRHGIPLIVNDRLDVALAVDAAGVHLGQEDLPLQQAKRLAPENFIIGLSVHNLKELNVALEAGAEYIGVGAIFPTETKRDESVVGVSMIRECRARTGMPMVAIGGINLENLPQVIEAGADGVAVISALLKADDVRTRARDFVQGVKGVAKLEVD